MSKELKLVLNQDNVKKKFEEMLGKKSSGFLSSLMQTVSNNNLLQKADPQSVLSAAATAASLDLPINQSLGFAWIVPYRGQAQFQMGWKGYVQLAQRTGQYHRINCVEVYENQFKGFNALTEELDADLSIEGQGEVVGYVAYLKMVSGFEKTVYWTKDQVVKHAGKYSQTFGKTNRSGNLIHSPWNDKDQFDAMAKKTVLKNTISKWGIMSIELTTGLEADQSVQQKEGSYEYPDNTVDIAAEEESEEASRALEHLSKCSTVEDCELLEESWPDMPDEIREKVQEKKQSLKKSA